jgi:hypothetical protein
LENVCICAHDFDYDEDRILPHLTLDVSKLPITLKKLVIDSKWLAIDLNANNASSTKLAWSCTNLKKLRLECDPNFFVHANDLVQSLPKNLESLTLSCGFVLTLRESSSELSLPNMLKRFEVNIMDTLVPTQLLCKNIISALKRMPRLEYLRLMVDDQSPSFFDNIADLFLACPLLEKIQFCDENSRYVSYMNRFGSAYANASLSERAKILKRHVTTLVQ